MRPTLYSGRHVKCIGMQKCDSCTTQYLPHADILFSLNHILYRILYFGICNTLRYNFVIVLKISVQENCYLLGFLSSA